MPQSHPSPVTSEETPPSATAPNPAHGTLETSWIDEWGMAPEASFPDAWSARLKASVSGAPDAWSVGLVASIPGVSDAWGVGPELLAAYALSPAARGLRAATSEAGERSEPPPVATAGTRRRGE